MTKFAKWMVGTLVLCGMSAGVMASETKTVYHINDSTVAGVAMNNIKNHLAKCTYAI